MNLIVSMATADSGSPIGYYPFGCIASGVNHNEANSIIDTGATLKGVKADLYIIATEGNERGRMASFGRITAMGKGSRRVLSSVRVTDDWFLVNGNHITQVHPGGPVPPRSRLLSDQKELAHWSNGFHLKWLQCHDGRVMGRLLSKYGLGVHPTSALMEALTAAAVKQVQDAARLDDTHRQVMQAAMDVFAAVRAGDATEAIDRFLDLPPFMVGSAGGNISCKVAALHQFAVLAVSDRRFLETAISAASQLLTDGQRQTAEIVRAHVRPSDALLPSMLWSSTHGCWKDTR